MKSVKKLLILLLAVSMLLSSAFTAMATEGTEAAAATEEPEIQNSSMAAPVDVNAQLTGNGKQVKVNWGASPDGSGALLGYYIYRSCDNQDPVQVNSKILSATDTGYVDSTVLNPGKLYTYYVVARYDNGSSKYLSMNSQSSTVVWGIPLEAAETGKYTGSMFGNGSVSMIVAMAALGVAVASLGITLTSKKKKSSEKAEDEA